MNEHRIDLNWAIFDDPPDTLGDDESHYGHLIAAMGGRRGIEIARTFTVARHRLLAEARTSGKTWEAAHPILYCYRHALELYLKALIRPDRRNHGLKALWMALHDRIQGVSERTKSRGSVIGLESSTQSTAFRYHDSHLHGTKPERWVDFHNFARQVERMSNEVEKFRFRMMTNDPSFGRFP